MTPGVSVPPGGSVTPGVSVTPGIPHMELKKYRVIVSARGSDNLNKMADVIEQQLPAKGLRALDFTTDPRGARIEMLLETPLPKESVANELLQILNSSREAFTRSKERFSLKYINVVKIKK